MKLFLFLSIVFRGCLLEYFFGVCVEFGMFYCGVNYFFFVGNRVVDINGIITLAGWGFRFFYIVGLFLVFRFRYFSLDIGEDIFFIRV